jgi:hypothetical protein
VVPPRSNRVSRAPPYSRTCRLSTRTGLSPALARHSSRFRFLTTGHWPGPRSLATTSGVSVDVLSSGYLDVSVPRVRLASLWIQLTIPLAGWVAPFGNPRIKACSRLPKAFRSVPRPSSPLDAKASTKCPSFTRHRSRHKPEPRSVILERQAYPCLSEVGCRMPDVSQELNPTSDGDL